MLSRVFLTLIAGFATAATTGLGAPLASVVAGESQALINWVPPASAINGIEIEESIDSGNNWVPVTKLPPTSTHIRIQNLTDGKNYWFRVRWIWPDNSLGIPSATLVAIPIKRPDSPTGLVATASDTQVALSWDQITGKNIIGYDIEQSTDGGSTWKVVNPNTGSSSAGFLINGLNPGTTYTYRIKALGFGGGVSEYSESAVVKIGTTTPGGFPLNYTVVGSKVTLTWETPQDLPDVATYQVNTSGDGGVNWFQVATTQGGINTAVVPYVIGGSTYQVIATSAAGQTSASAIQLIETNAIPDPVSISTPGASGATPPNSGGSASPTPASTIPTVLAKGSSLPIIPIAVVLIGMGIGISILIGSRNRSKKGGARKRPKPKRKPSKKRNPRQS